jgi:hypothetical protein
MRIKLLDDLFAHEEPLRGPIRPRIEKPRWAEREPHVKDRNAPTRVSIRYNVADDGSPGFPARIFGMNPEHVKATGELFNVFDYYAGVTDAVPRKKGNRPSRKKRQQYAAGNWSNVLLPGADTKQQEDAHYQLRLATEATYANLEANLEVKAAYDAWALNPDPIKNARNSWKVFERAEFLQQNAAWAKSVSPNDNPIPQSRASWMAYAREQDQLAQLEGMQTIYDARAAAEMRHLGSSGMGASRIHTSRPEKSLERRVTTNGTEGHHNGHHQSDVPPTRLHPYATRITTQNGHPPRRPMDYRGHPLPQVALR